MRLLSITLIMAEKKLTDKELLDLFKNKSKTELVFSQLIKKYAEPLYYQIRKITRNHEETNDILQNVWIKVFKSLSSFNSDSSLYTWLYRIARNETINHMNKEKRHRSIDVDDSFIEIISGHHVLNNFSEEKVQEALLEAINQLPEKQALVFQLKFFDELKYSEISLRLNTSEGALKASYHIAVQKIESFLLNKLNL